MNYFQAGILAPLPFAARHLFFSIAEGDAHGIRASLDALRGLADGDATVVGLGQSLTLALGAQIQRYCQMLCTVDVIRRRLYAAA